MKVTLDQNFSNIGSELEVKITNHFADLNCFVQLSSKIRRHYGIRLLFSMYIRLTAQQPTICNTYHIMIVSVAVAAF